MGRKCEVTHKEIKAMARWGIAKWCDIYLPKDGDYRDPEIVTDRVPTNGRTVNDGDYAVVMIFHNNKLEGANQ